MAAVFFLLLLVVPIVELWIIVQAAGELGLLPTLVLLLLISVAGAWLLKQQGMQTWGRLQTTLRSGRMPTDEVTDGALILLGGALLLTPGFLTDLVGLLFLIPPTRLIVKSTARRLLGRWSRRRLRTSTPRAWVSRGTSPTVPGTDDAGVRRGSEGPREIGDGSRGRD